MGSSSSSHGGRGAKGPERWMSLQPAADYSIQWTFSSRVSYLLSCSWQCKRCTAVKVQGLELLQQMVQQLGQESAMPFLVSGF